MVFIAPHLIYQQLLISRDADAAMMTRVDMLARDEYACKQSWDKWIYVRLNGGTR